MQRSIRHCCAIAALLLTGCASPPGGGMLGEMFPTMTLKADMVPVLMQHVRESDPRTVAAASAS